jgi:hypothetical protein
MLRSALRLPTRPPNCARLAASAEDHPTDQPENGPDYPVGLAVEPQQTVCVGLGSQVVVSVTC